MENSNSTIIPISVDPNDWVKVSDITDVPFQCEQTNPLQTTFFKNYKHGMNAIVEAATSSGKTRVAEGAIFKALQNHERALYVAPLKALTQEKIDDWTDKNHFFGNKHIEIATGDYSGSEGQREELLRRCEQADIIIMTTEFFDSLTRKGIKYQNVFKNVSVAVVDESHLLAVPSRGAALETAIMRFTQMTNGALVFLSATMPNSVEIAEWVRNLNQRETLLIKSTWRPVELQIHFEQYLDQGGWMYKKQNLIDAIKNRIDSFEDDKFIVFVHSKAFGRQLLKDLSHAGYRTEFHNADLKKDDRISFVERFKERVGDDRIQILIATSSLAWGINTPARRVIIADIKRGGEVVPIYDLQQMAGRAGRFGIDTEGDVHYILPRSKYNTYVKYVSESNMPVLSRLSNVEELAFHIIHEIADGKNTIKLLSDWYKRSLSAFATNNPQTSEDILVDTVVKLQDFSALTVDSSGDDDIFTVTAIGKIASMFYQSPFFVSRLYKNFKRYGLTAFRDDYMLSWALGSAFDAPPSSSVAGIKEYSERVLQSLMRSGQPFGADVANIMAQASIPYAFYCMLTSHKYGIPEEIESAVRGLKMDLDRLNATLDTLQSFYKKDLQFCDFKSLAVRLKYEVSRDIAMSGLCSIQGIGGVRAKKLWDAGFKTSEAVFADPEKVMKLTGIDVSGGALKHMKKETKRTLSKVSQQDDEKEGTVKLHTFRAKTDTDKNQKTLF